MSTQSQNILTPEQYLEIERKAESKSEYYGGEMFAMSGGTGPHAFISSNILIAAGAALRGSECRAVNSDLRIFTSSGLYTYADAMIICGKPQYLDNHIDIVTNPTVIFEVLSPSTARYDRGAKFHQYQQIPSLREYVLVAQNTFTVERFERQPDGRWMLSMHRGPEAVLALASVPCTLALADIYADVDIAAGDHLEH